MRILIWDAHTRMGQYFVPYEYFICMFYFFTGLWIMTAGICNSCNMAMRDLPDMYTRSPRAAGPRDEGIHIRQITNGHVTSIMYHFVPIVTKPVV